LDLERLDELQETFYSDAVKGDVQAATILLNIAERRSAYLGIDAPVRVDPVQLGSGKPRPTSTDPLRLRYAALLPSTNRKMTIP
jgi:hypothetical protein